MSFDTSGTPEFDGWEWVNYWYPINAVVSFKRNVYRHALQEFSEKTCALSSNLEVLKYVSLA